MVVVWDDLAVEDIAEKYRWYDATMGRSAAQKFANGVYRDASLLERNPMLGKAEPLLNDIYGKQRWRSLTSARKFKIVYRLDEQEVRIVAVWACVRSQNLLRRIIKTRK